MMSGEMSAVRLIRAVIAPCNSPWALAGTERDIIARGIAASPGAAAGEDEFHAGSDEFARDAFANAAGGTGDDSCLNLEAHGVLLG